MSFFRAHLDAMEGYHPGEQPTNDQYIKLNTNENPYPPSPLVIEILKKSINQQTLSLYPSPLCDEVRKKASEVYGYPPEWILVGNGSDELLSIVFRAFLGKDDRVLYPYPTYTLYRVLALLQEALYDEFPFNPDFTIPKTFFSEPGRLKIICNPNSPTGTYIPSDTIEELLKSSFSPVIVDEAYIDFAPSSSLSLLKRYSHLIILRTLSKSFSLAGIRIGILIAHPEIINGLLKLKDSYNVNCFAQKAAIAALHDIDYMKKNVERIKQTRRRISKELHNLGYTVLPSEANFVMVKCPGKSLEPDYLYLKSNNILVRFFPEWPDSLRISIGTDSHMQTLLQTLKKKLAN